MSSHVADDDVLRRESLAKGCDHLLWWKGRGALPDDRGDRPLERCRMALVDPLGKLRQRFVELPDHLDRGLVVAIELRGGAVDVHHALVPLWVPKGWGPLDEVIADRDHEVGGRELRDVRELRARSL